MKRKSVINISVPASTANLGPGFDSIGLAVNLYLKVEAEVADQWEFTSTDPDLQECLNNDDNIILNAASRVAEIFERTLDPCSVRVESEIPLARGLGSSAAAIAAGVELANVLLQLHLSQEEKVHYGSQIEGHPDNVGASVMGGLIVASEQEGETYIVSNGCPKFDIVVVIPSYELRTSDARNVLPKTFTYDLAVKASSKSNVLVASMLSEKWDIVGKMMESDLFHQPYRKTLVNELDAVNKEAKKRGAFGVCLSGAGPTMICFSEEGKGTKIKNELSSLFPDCDVKQLYPDVNGTVVEILEEKVENFL
jgi:homoserine kinase